MKGVGGLHGYIRSLMLPQPPVLGLEAVEDESAGVSAPPLFSVGAAAGESGFCQFMIGASCNNGCVSYFSASCTVSATPLATVFFKSEGELNLSRGLSNWLMSYKFLLTIFWAVTYLS